MNILHYSLGFPPYRRGGMTKYCIDLMAEQLRVGHNVAMIWPGRIKKYGYKCDIKEGKKENIGKNFSCLNYEIINPLPVPLLNGIKKIDAFIQPKEDSVFYDFLKKKNINIIHIHTLMGLLKEFISAAKNLGIKVIYTSHDYFGLCPKLGFIYNGQICNNDNYEKCIACNETSLSLNKIKLLQSSLYRSMKDTKLIKHLRKIHNKSLNEYVLKNNIEIIDDEDSALKIGGDYRKLQKFYIELLEMIDTIHFNSYNTKMKFEKYISKKQNSKVLSITHASILDNRKIKRYENKIRLGYLGSIEEHKGFHSLKSVCDELHNIYEDKFELNIFANYEGKEKYIVQHEPYKYNELSKVMNYIDILIVPSLSETFGFTVLEALSYGVPVIVSKYVGAKDLIEHGKSGMIYNELDELVEILKNIINHKVKLKDMNNYIVDYVLIKDIIKHSIEIEQLYTN